MSTIEQYFTKPQSDEDLVPDVPTVKGEITQIKLDGQEFLVTVKIPKIGSYRHYETVIAVENRYQSMFHIGQEVQVVLGVSTDV